VTDEPTVRIDEDAVLWSASAADRAGRPLLVLLHGYNSHEGDLFGLAPHLPLEPAIASLRAPLGTGYGYTWFPLREQGAAIALAGAQSAVEAVLAWLDGLDPAPTSVGIAGFSQGGAIALELLRAAPERFDFAVSLAGFTLATDAPGPPGETSEHPGDAMLAARRPPVFWGRGTADEVIAPVLVEHTQRWLPRHSTLTERIYEGLGHSVSQAELADLVAFLRERYVDAGG
jgi:phospholipase/carboxylesterase